MTEVPMPAPEAAGAFAFMAILMGVLFVIAISVGIAIFICILLSRVLKRVPQQFRQMEPGMVWLLLIPCFNLVWNFFVFLRVPASLKAYFNSIGRTDVGDCGRGLGLGYAICAACGSAGFLIPPLSGLASLAGLVLLILFLVRVLGLKSQISAPQA